ncbi:dTDP-4-dehydrorhamnose reductase [Virgibacillus natechei]|uniref:dTDP-4-dehydrorhamnose reductase n=1 Tax=Virgibacillus natechei TaxID=1216297 RepID=A0ABS4IFU4_9BACI|nr:sugar nucleotide-binding protein [Virgibacillus natechei]MBP1969811.1 dTDP-4-dehydrorhamnose reductase [Virgibacillus natechei]UZD12656.1 sugar nucleotide-binding protein [Virgibacillus natechei]
MKVCVFGASGYVGTSVYKSLESMEDFEVSGTYLDHNPIFDNLYKLDINEPESFSDFFKKESPDVVIWSVMNGPNEHVLTDQGLLHLITHLTPATKLIYISSDFVYSAGKGPYVEEDPLSTLPNDHLFSTYTNAKVKAERFILNELSNYVILRVGPVYGENQAGKMDERTEKLFRQLDSGQPIAFRDDLIRTFVHVEDLANVIVEMLEKDIIGIFNVGPSEKRSFYEFMSGIADQFGYHSNLVEKDSEYEEADQEIPKDTSLITEKITKTVNQNFR